MGGGGVGDLRSVEKFEIVVLESGRQLTQEAESSEALGEAEDVHVLVTPTCNVMEFPPIGLRSLGVSRENQMAGLRKGWNLSGSCDRSTLGSVS